MSAGHLYLFTRASLFKSLILMRRYLFNTVAQIVSMYMLFAVMFFGGQQVAGAAITESIDGIIVGYFLWMLIMSAYSSIAGNITNEAQWGTLEQLYMSPLGFDRVVGVKTVVNVAVSLLVSTTLLVLMLATMEVVSGGVALSLDPLTVVPIVVLTLAPAVGLGYIFGGLALLYKRVESAFQLMQFAFVGLVAAPVEQFPLFKFAPFSLGSYLLREAMGQQKSLLELPAADLGLLVAVGVVYLGIGYGAFRFVQRTARERGVLGEY
ncbi:ABC transporter permease [Halorussus sp. MSC15.2]|uniref:ABC transporter permease n=1 Tax=Halorussus sp. MSC15.2 TaxID=2283638 RepID=UPI0013CF77DF|nr:ABC transporter permease [Halorussus sp. MSC15.2]NEU56672.1 ABC transporter permease [Halorussus sp. MSC15.2]